MTNLHNAITALITALNETRDTIYAEANANKDALLAARNAMATSQLKMNEYVDTVAMLANVADELSEDMNVSAENVGVMLSDMDIFALPIERFDGICDICGKELDIDEEQFMDEDGDGFICAACDKELHPEPEIELKESVHEEA